VWGKGEVRAMRQRWDNKKGHGSMGRELREQGEKPF